MKITDEIVDDIVDGLLADDRSGDNCIVITNGGIAITDEGIYRMKSIINAKLTNALEAILDALEMFEEA